MISMPVSPSAIRLIGPLFLSILLLLVLSGTPTGLVVHAIALEEPQTPLEAARKPRRRREELPLSGTKRAKISTKPRRFDSLEQLGRESGLKKRPSGHRPAKTKQTTRPSNGAQWTREVNASTPPAYLSPEMEAANHTGGHLWRYRQGGTTSSKATPPKTEEEEEEEEIDLLSLLDDDKKISEYPESVQCEAALKTSSTYFRPSVLYYCTFDKQKGPFLILTLFLILISFYMLSVVSDTHFSASLAQIANYLDLSNEVAGTVFLSLANGAPDLFTTIASSTSDENWMMILGNALGGALFITNVVLALSILSAALYHRQLHPASKEVGTTETAFIQPIARITAGWKEKWSWTYIRRKLAVSPTFAGHRVIPFPYYRNLLVFTASVAAVFGFFASGSLQLWQGLLLLIAYAAFIIAVLGRRLFIRWRRRHREKGAKKQPSSITMRETEEVNPQRSRETTFSPISASDSTELLNVPRESRPISPDQPKQDDILIMVTEYRGTETAEADLDVSELVVPAGSAEVDAHTLMYLFFSAILLHHVLTHRKRPRRPSSASMTSVKSGAAYLPPAFAMHLVRPRRRSRPPSISSRTSSSFSSSPVRQAMPMVDPTAPATLSDDPPHYPSFALFLQWLGHSTSHWFKEESWWGRCWFFLKLPVRVLFAISIPPLLRVIVEDDEEDINLDQEAKASFALPGEEQPVREPGERPHSLHGSQVPATHPLRQPPHMYFPLQKRAYRKAYIKYLYNLTKLDAENALLYRCLSSIWPPVLAMLSVDVFGQWHAVVGGGAFPVWVLVLLIALAVSVLHAWATHGLLRSATQMQRLVSMLPDTRQTRAVHFVHQGQVEQAEGAVFPPVREPSDLSVKQHHHRFLRFMAWLRVDRKYLHRPALPATEERAPEMVQPTFTSGLAPATGLSTLRARSPRPSPLSAVVTYDQHPPFALTEDSSTSLPRLSAKTPIAPLITAGQVGLHSETARVLRLIQERYAAICPTIHKLYYFDCAMTMISFATCVLWVYVVANEAVDLLHTLSDVCHFSNSFVGITLMAWGNSFGDLFADMAVARSGDFPVALTACFTGPIQNQLLTIGVIITLQCIRGTATGVVQKGPASVLLQEIPLNLYVTLGFTIGAALLVLGGGVFFATRGRMPVLLAYILLIYYLVFLAVVAFLG